MNPDDPALTLAQAQDKVVMMLLNRQQGLCLRAACVGG
jgi:hypothetical protein